MEWCHEWSDSPLAVISVRTVWCESQRLVVPLSKLNTGFARSVWDHRKALTSAQKALRTERVSFETPSEQLLIRPGDEAVMFIDTADATVVTHFFLIVLLAKLSSQRFWGLGRTAIVICGRITALWSYGGDRGGWFLGFREAGDFSRRSAPAQSGVALRLPPHSKFVFLRELRSRLSLRPFIRILLRWRSLGGLACGLGRFGGF